MVHCFVQAGEEPHTFRSFFVLIKIALDTYIVLVIVQALISVQALVFDLAQLTCQKRFDCRNVILGSSAMFLGTSYS